jgi:hypothetical protein
MDSRRKFFISQAAGSRLSGTPFPTSANSLPCILNRSALGLQTQDIAELGGVPTLFQPVSSKPHGRERTAGAGDVHTIPTRSARPNPIGTPVFQPFREKQFTPFLNEEMNGTTMQLFVVTRRPTTSVGASRARQQSGIVIASHTQPLPHGKVEAAWP